MKKLFFISFILVGTFFQMNAQSNSDAVLNNIFNRKSVRSFIPDKKISRDTLELVVKLGMAAPSGMNKQPWEFLVVEDSAIMGNLADKLPYAKMLKSASAAIVVIGNPKLSKLWMLDCSAASQNILLAIESLGLGGVWTAGWPYEDRMSEIKTAFGIPDPFLPLCVIPLGYPNGEQKPKDKWKPEKLHFNKW